MDLNSKPVNTGSSELSPQEETLRRRNNRSSRWKWIMVLVVLIIIAASGTVYYYSENSDDEPRLSVRQAVKLFAQEGIYLTKTSDPEVVEINEVKPTTYFINDSENKLIIYHYDSIAERNVATDIWRTSRRDQENSFYGGQHYEAKNLLFAMKPIDNDKMTIEDLKSLGQVEDIIFEKLNDTQELVFTGRSDNWEVKTVVKYYEYFYSKEDGTLSYDSYHNEYSELKYLGEDVESVVEISYTERFPGGGCSGTGHRLTSDGTVRIGLGGGNGSFPRADSELHFTIQWNDKEETFTARSTDS